MAGLTGVRVALADGLEGIGYRVVDHIPARIAPPTILLGTGDPYVTPHDDGDTFDQSEYLANFELYLLAGTASNAKAVAELEDMITVVLRAVVALGFGVGTVSAPYMARANDSQYLTVRITSSTEIDLDDQADTTTTEGTEDDHQ